MCWSLGPSACPPPASPCTKPSPKGSCQQTIVSTQFPPPTEAAEAALSPSVGGTRDGRQTRGGPPGSGWGRASSWGASSEHLATAPPGRAVANPLGWRGGSRPSEPPPAWEGEKISPDRQRKSPRQKGFGQHVLRAPGDPPAPPARYVLTPEIPQPRRDLLKQDRGFLRVFFAPDNF